VPLVDVQTLVLEHAIVQAKRERGVHTANDEQRKNDPYPPTAT